MRVESVHIYPVKSTGSVTVSVADVELAGLRHDRRWAVVGTDGVALTASRHDRLLAVTATPDRGGNLAVTADDRPPLCVPVPAAGARTPIDLSRVRTAVDAGDEAARWFSDHLGLPVRLVWQDDPAGRGMSVNHGGTGVEPLSLADAGPLLLTTTSSLARLNAWIAADHDSGDGDMDMEMARFRPNVVVDGPVAPFAEDHWRVLGLGDVRYRFAEHCDRCVVTTIDPATLVHGKEPIRTLARHRKWDGETWFGIRIVPLGTGKIAVGDRCEVLGS